MSFVHLGKSFCEGPTTLEPPQLEICSTGRGLVFFFFLTARLSLGLSPDRENFPTPLFSSPRHNPLKKIKPPCLIKLEHKPRPSRVDLHLVVVESAERQYNGRRSSQDLSYYCKCLLYAIKWRVKTEATSDAVSFHAVWASTVTLEQKGSTSPRLSDGGKALKATELLLDGRIEFACAGWSVRAID